MPAGMHRKHDTSQAAPPPADVADKGVYKLQLIQQKEKNSRRTLCFFNTTRQQDTPKSIENFSPPRRKVSGARRKTITKSFGCKNKSFILTTKSFIFTAKTFSYRIAPAAEKNSPCRDNDTELYIILYFFEKNVPIVKGFNYFCFQVRAVALLTLLETRSVMLKLL